MAKFNRRAVMAGSALAVGVMITPKANAEPSPLPQKAPIPASESMAQRLIKRAQENLHPITHDGTGFSGAGWDILVSEGRSSEFFLLGEEHGIAEIPVLTGALFEALRPAGFDKLAIEVSAPIADDMDEAAKLGITGLRDYFAKHPPGPAFYFWRSEAELLAKVRRLVPHGEQAIWGLDYEVISDRQLIERLKSKAPNPARAALDALDKASLDGWARWKAEKNPEFLPMFSLKPQLVHAVQAAWKSPDRQSAIILDVLAETLEINLLQQTTGWGSNKRRADFNRKCLIRLLSQSKASKPPKILFKFGSNHTMRGVTWTGVFDIGSLAAEVAALRGGKSFHLLVGGGANSTHGVLDATDMSVKTQPVDMIGDEFGMAFLLDVMPKAGLGLLDLRPLRRLVSSAERLKELNNPEAVRVIHAYDMMLVWNGSTATTMLG
jgi:hypothetical protein